MSAIVKALRREDSKFTDWLLDLDQLEDRVSFLVNAWHTVAVHQCLVFDNHDTIRRVDDGLSDQGRYICNSSSSHFMYLPFLILETWQFLRSSLPTSIARV